MIVRSEITQPRGETVRQAHRPEQGRRTGARSPEDERRTRAVRRGFEGRARWPQACHNSGSAIAAEES
jgi:hypothetical protein